MHIIFRRSILLALFGCSVLFVSACSEKGKTTSPGVVSFNKAALYPEGVEYDPAGQRFLVTSLREGVVGAVTDSGVYQEFINDPRLVSAIGIRIDHAGDRVLVCNSDPGVSIHTKKQQQGKLAGLGIYKLSTGQRIKYIDLGALTPGGHFCNDIALDKAGNAYISDSFSPIIYKLDNANNASVLLNHQGFTGKGFNLNGLVVKDDYLLVAKDNEGVLFKVPLSDPQKFSQVKIDQTLHGADGSLIVIANGSSNKVFKLTSADNWASARVIKSRDTGPVFATTGVLRGEDVYVLNARLNVLFNPDTKAHIETFEIHKYKM